MEWFYIYEVIYEWMDCLRYFVLINVLVVNMLLVYEVLFCLMKIKELFYFESIVVVFDGLCCFWLVYVNVMENGLDVNYFD